MIFMRMLKGMVLSAVTIVLGLILLVLLGIGLLYWGVPFAFTVGLIVTVSFLGFLVLRYGRAPERGKTVIRIEPLEGLFWHDCNDCTAGTQALLGGRWGPIPPGMRMTRNGVRMFMPPLGNVRDCSECRGRGGFLLPYPPEAKEVMP